MPGTVRHVALATLTCLAIAMPASGGANAGASIVNEDHARQFTRPNTVWDRLAECETGGNWRHHNSTYQGGLGFYHGSWDAYRPRRFPRDAHLASRTQQIVVGKRILADVGWGAWPACSILLGLR